MFAQMHRWWAAGETVAIATVVRTWASAPRPPGSFLLVGPDDSVVGSVSGGCVDGAVYDLARAVRAGVAPDQLQRYGVSDDDAFAVGLTCGGTIDVFVQAVGRASFPELADVVADQTAGRPVAVATVIATGRPDQLGRHLVVGPDSRSNTLGDPGLDDEVTDEARTMLAGGISGTRALGSPEQASGDVEVFIASCAPAPRMIVFGAVDVAAAVAELGRFLGYRVTVCDARAVFVTAGRFPDAHDVIVDWPHRYLASTDVGPDTVICVFTHDLKFDVPLLEVALRLPVAYVGAMGSRRTNDRRIAALRERGMNDQDLARLHAPIGLDVGARTAQETAVSVAAELIAVRYGASGAPLREAGGPIHR